MHYIRNEVMTENGKYEKIMADICNCEATIPRRDGITLFLQLIFCDEILIRNKVDVTHLSILHETKIFKYGNAFFHVKSITSNEISKTSTQLQIVADLFPHIFHLRICVFLDDLYLLRDKCTSYPKVNVKATYR